MRKCVLIFDVKDFFKILIWLKIGQDKNLNRLNNLIELIKNNEKQENLYEKNYQINQFF